MSEIKCSLSKDLKLRCVPKLNRQRRLSRPAPIDSARHTTTDQQRFDNCVPEFVVHQPDEAANEELHVLVHQPVLSVLPRRSTRVNLFEMLLGIEFHALIALGRY